MDQFTETLIAVRDFYLSRANELPLGTRFHFLSRCFLWSRKDEYLVLLKNIEVPWREGFLREAEILQRLKDDPLSYTPKGKGKRYRATYKEKYGAIYAYNRFFFKCLFDRVIFEGNAFETFRHLIDIESLTSLHTNLKNDPSAVRVLSTPAVNFLYHSQYFFEEDLSRISPEYVCEVGEAPVDLSVPDANDATLYLYTHGIINASLFYSREIADAEMPSYTKLLKKAENILEGAFAGMSLDHKCEFLVCAELCDTDSSLRERIQAELERSLSPNGMYFVNTENSHRRDGAPRKFTKMEHTNVLALMAFLGRD